MELVVILGKICRKSALNFFYQTVLHALLITDKTSVVGTSSAVLQKYLQEWPLVALETVQTEEN